ncbi:MAG TPA: electron transfer flavoprotein subunit alpha/FixB family protein [Ktedonobacteraceae bacterium]|jgi:electron transfer flavoprotein alpha subunit|nr:electron transfer flavoprotein subunit alpha/FixB family protein [Ktedonobacteraceae bacterium]
MTELWAVLQHSEDVLEEHSGELIAELVEMAQRQPEKAQVRALLLQAPDTPLPDTALLSRLNVSSLYVLEHPQLSHYLTEAYVSALSWLIKQGKPALVATSATANGRDFMPRLAARLRLPFVPACLSIDLHDDALYTMRAIYDGRAYMHALTELHRRTALATLLPGVRGNPVLAPDNTTTLPELEITRFTAEISDMHEGRITRVALQAPSPEEVELEEAERIVAGGRGVGREGFSTIASFARLLGAAVGATRVATDRGWVEHVRQIGATGKSVQPKLYIACGISGAPQHTSGMREAQTVVAINPDRTAPIFALADLGLLGDANKILPLAAELIRKKNV